MSDYMKVGNGNGNSYNVTKTLKQAIKDYEDEYLTGLTDEEREIIDTLCKAYLKERPIQSKSDLESYFAFVKSLLKKFGYKGDYEAFVSKAETNMESPIENPKQTPKDTTKADTVETTVITEADGSKYVLIKTQNGMSFKIKISDDAEIKDKNLMDKKYTKEKSKDADSEIISKYEKTIQTEQKSHFSQKA